MLEVSIPFLLTASQQDLPIALYHGRLTFSTSTIHLLLSRPTGTTPTTYRGGGARSEHVHVYTWCSCYNVIAAGFSATCTALLQDHVLDFPRVLATYRHQVVSHKARRWYLPAPCPLAGSPDAHTKATYWRVSGINNSLLIYYYYLNYHLLLLLKLSVGWHIHSA